MKVAFIFSVARLILSSPSSSWRLLRWIIRTHTVDFQIKRETQLLLTSWLLTSTSTTMTMINLRYLHLNEHKAWRLSWYPAEINHWHIISYFISLFRTCEMKTIPSWKTKDFLTLGLLKEIRKLFQAIQTYLTQFRVTKYFFLSLKFILV